MPRPCMLDLYEELKALVTRLTAGATDCGERLPDGLR